MKTESGDNSAPSTPTEGLISQSLPRWAPPPMAKGPGVDDDAPAGEPMSGGQKRPPAHQESRVIEGKVRRVKVRAARFDTHTWMDLLQLFLTIVFLTVPVFALLLLGVWLPEGMHIEFASMWQYLGLALALTVGVIVVDLALQGMTALLGLDRAAAWIVEQFLAALALSFALWPVTGLFLGALLWALIIEVCTVLLSVMFARIFR